MRRVLFDTSVYIPLFREGVLPAPIAESSLVTIYLSVAVVQELYVGTADPFSRKQLDKFCEAFEKELRVITPTEDEWKVCGRTLCLMGQKHGYDSIRKGRLVNDVLIALSCQRVNATLFTKNHGDFQIIQEVVDFDFVKS